MIALYEMIQHWQATLAVLAGLAAVITFCVWMDSRNSRGTYRIRAIRTAKGIMYVIQRKTFMRWHEMTRTEHAPIARHLMNQIIDTECVSRPLAHQV